LEITVNGVSTLENGIAIQIRVDPGRSTSMRASASARNAFSTSLASSESACATSAAEGADEVSIICW
jgi:hypothetical protein